MMPVIVVRVPAGAGGAGGAGLRRERALLFFRGLKDETQDSRADNKYCGKNGYLHLNGSSGCKSIPR